MQEERDIQGEEYMDFDYTAYEYLPECTDGCGAITGWLPSKDTANNAARNHQKDKGHKWFVRERMKRSQESLVNL